MQINVQQPAVAERRRLSVNIQCKSCARRPLPEGGAKYAEAKVTDYSVLGSNVSRSRLTEPVEIDRSTDISSRHVKNAKSIKSLTLSYSNCAWQIPVSDSE